MQQPDTKPGFYYVTALDGRRAALVLGPFENDHAAALAAVEPARRRAEEIDPKACWYAFGTARADTNLGPGRLNNVPELAQLLGDQPIGA